MGVEAGLGAKAFRGQFDSVALLNFTHILELSSYVANCAGNPRRISTCGLAQGRLTPPPMPNRLLGILLGAPAWSLNGPTRKDYVLQMEELSCWDFSWKSEAEVFHVHIPKVAGCSVVRDLTTMIGRKQVMSQEYCYSMSQWGKYEHVLLMLREPRDHVLAQYEMCDLATDPGYKIGASKYHALKGEWNHTLPDTFEKWVDEWYTSPRFGQFTLQEDKDVCYCPYNMQSYRLT